MQTQQNCILFYQLIVHLSLYFQVYNLARKLTKVEQNGMRTGMARAQSGMNSVN